MYLPKIPYTMAKNRSLIVAMRGINYSNMLTDGDMADSKNISARSYPYVTTRKSRTEVGDYSDISALTVFQGKFVVVKGTDLLCDGVVVGQVTRGEKQFAIINTKLVIMPDKVYLDGETMELCPMGADVLCAEATFTKDSMIVGDTSKLLTSGKGVFEDSTFMSGTETIWTREVDFERNILRFHLEITFVVIGKRTINIYIDSNDESNVKSLNGQHVYSYTGTSGPLGPIYKYVGKITSITGGVATLDRDIEYSISTESKYGKIFYTGDIKAGDNLTFELGGETYIRANVIGVGDGKIILDVGTETYIDEKTSNVKRELMPDLTKIVEPGQTIMFSAGNFKSSITSVSHNTITMSEPFTISGEHYTEIYRERDSIELFKAGDAVEISGSVNDGVTFIISKIENGTIYAESEIFTEGVSELIYIRRKIPDLDFICESNNRIWGCSNKDRVIYASALGDPTNFFDYSGESTDSFAVSVGSPEDFTGCIGLGSNGVLFFKESKIHKVLGSYPAEYYMYDYDFEGVQRGCHKSLQIINEVIYYKGRHGVYAFNGSPVLISSNFGEKTFTDAVAGSDGDTYYISMRDGSKNYLFAYEIQYGMWVLESNDRAIDFARKSGDMYMLCEDGKFYLCGTGDSETGIEWFVQFTPFYESIEGKKSYSRIVLRVELPQKSYLAVDVRADGGAWREVGKVIGKREGIVPVSVPINRCDKFEIRLRGRGKCTIHQIKREFFLGGDK